MRAIRNIAKATLGTVGLEVRRKPSLDDEGRAGLPAELSQAERDLLFDVKRNNLSMTSYERLSTTLLACKHAIEQNIDGDFVECGVWRGGHALIAAAMFRMYGVDKRVFLFDTFEGMTTPTEKDRETGSGRDAMNTFIKHQRQDFNEWCYASLEDVRNNFKERDLLDDRVIFVKGDVCTTLDSAPCRPTDVCVLRLDTDWYESTKKELEVLYPMLSLGGVLILDDYGDWEGAREATDEYFSKHMNCPFLQPSDNTGRVGVKYR